MRHVDNRPPVPWPVHRTVMSTLRRLSVVIVATVGVGVLNVVSVAQSLTLEKVLAQLGDYLVTYEDTLSAVVAQEEYEQEYRYSAGTQTVTRKRLLRSDFLFLRLPEEVLWFGVRDAILVDGKPVRDRAPRLDNVLTAGGGNPLPELTRIAAENARYNLGDVVRTINAPTQVLALLHPRHRARFTFRKVGEETIERQRLWRVGFREIIKPSLIKTVEGADQLATGTVWVHPNEGSVVRTVLELGGDLAVDYLRTRITVEFAQDTRLRFRVPVSMVEVYSRPGVRIVASASYTNFRQFQTIVRIGPK